MPPVKTPKAFSRAQFEALVFKNVMTVKDIIEQYNAGKLREDDYVFDLETLRTIAHDTYRGAWNNCRQLPSNKTDHCRHVGVNDAREIITEAFTT